MMSVERSPRTPKPYLTLSAGHELHTPTDITRTARKFLVPIAAAVLVASSLLVAALAPASVLASCGTGGTITYYDGPGGTGAHMTLCADEYPAAGESCSFDQTFCKFSDGTSPNNRIESSNFVNAALSTSIRVCTGYYFAGSCATVTKPPIGSGQIVNWGGIYSNSVSSLYSCGRDGCGDER